MASVDGFLFQKLFLCNGFFWVSVSSLFLTLFALLYKFYCRVGREASSDENNLNCLAVSLHESNQVDSCLLNSEAEIEERKSDSIEFEDTENDEEETPKYFLNFKFQSLEEFCKSNHENWDLVPSTSTNKYEFKSENYLSGFIEEPRDVSFSVKELYADSMNVSSGNQEVMADEFLLESDFMDQNLGEGTVDEEGEVAEKLELATLIEDEKQKPKDEEGLGDVVFLSENDLVASDSDADSITSSNELSVLSPYIGSTSDGFLSDKDFEEEFEFSIMRSIERDLEDLHLQKFSDDAAEDADDEDSDIMEELKHLEESDDVENSSTQGSEMLSGKDFHDENDSKNHEFSGKKNQATSSLNEANNSNLQNSSASVDSEDSNGLETLWEHQDLIEQLKMELKKVRAIGLPTILEESESPKIMEDLKPWKIDEKFQHEDRMGELHKFYRSYRERMRKFDILNYQKMYAIGFLQSKDPLKSISSLKLSAPGVSSLLSQNFLLGKRRKSESDPMKKFIRELHSDLEVVYVGQLCLSWEFLHWQYEKSLELWESDPYSTRKYNEVAGEFQQFQVLIQRFIENEPFEGPRVQNYIKNRCILRNLLQVPVIREDSKKDKKAKMKRRDEYVITSDMLVETMEESIRIFWRFVRADKDANVVRPKIRRRTQVEPQETLDLELLSEVRTSLQKKEKKLKDILRSGNCILRKFQKQEDSSDQVLYFFSQVDMKLVARVLNMSKITTDQLLWCRNKLSKINFVSRKIQVEPSFLLFPC
ncbi:uncharacterized protein LOC123197804 isoform X2 [Mangifera indica]|uniref:uncharacterized protein LOC123197804 isoform X2 n=1 Tax=Mangifera indica TaxID=29780 RepID=UPI001CFC42D8|nr:uncharacterized protein LOC123197804 isoform X2 [Mangifera indica]